MTVRVSGLCCMHETTDQSTQAFIENIPSDAGCEFAWTYVTVHFVGVEKTAGAVKVLMKMAFLRHCDNDTIYTVRGGKKDVLEKWFPGCFSALLIIRCSHQHQV